MSASGLDPRVERVLEALDDHDADAVAEQFATGGRYLETPRNEEFSRSEFRDYLAGGLFETVPDYRIVGRQVYTTDHWATTLRWSSTGTHAGEGGGSTRRGTLSGSRSCRW